MKRKKLFLLFVSVCLALVLAALLFPGCAKEAAPPTAGATEEELRAEIAELEKKLAEAEAEEAATPTVAPGEVIKWDAYFLYDPVPTGLVQRWMDEYPDEIAELSDGLIEITTYIMGEHPYGIFDGIKVMRDVHPAICELPFAQVTGEDPRLGVADLPMFFPADVDLYCKVLDDYVMPNYFAPIIEGDYGYNPFFTATWQAQRLGTIDFALENWDSLKGKKIRVWNPQLGDYITLLGGIPLSITWGEVYTSLMTGLVDGLITAGGDMYDYRFTEVVNYINLVEVQIGVDAICVSEEALDALPGDLAQKLLDWGKEEAPHMRTTYFAHGDIAILKSALNDGVTVTAPSPSFVEEVRDKCWEAIWEPWIERSGGAGSPAADAFNDVAKVLIDGGYTVPNYEPY